MLIQSLCDTPPEDLSEPTNHQLLFSSRLATKFTEALVTKWFEPFIYRYMYVQFRYYMIVTKLISRSIDYT